MVTQENDWRIALHEAGHAVVALRLGFGFLRVTHNDVEGSGMDWDDHHAGIHEALLATRVGQELTLVEREHLKRGVVMSLAGIAAEKAFGGEASESCPKLDNEGWRTDLSMAGEMTRLLFRGSCDRRGVSESAVGDLRCIEIAFLDACWRMAYLFVSTEMPLVRLVASQLYSSVDGELTHDQVVALVAESIGSSVSAVGDTEAGLQARPEGP